jgi:predicted transposase YdaD
MTTEENQLPSERAGASERVETIQSPHDRLLNQSLQQIDVARSLLAQHLPSELVQDLRLETLVHADTSFIDRTLRRRLADRLFSVEVSEQLASRLGMRTNYIYLMVLIEHKSTDEPSTVIQVAGYAIRILENVLENNRPLIPIVPWVIYNGVRPWRAARSFDQLIPVPESWKRYVLGLEVPILDVSRLDDAQMVGDPILQLTLKLLKYGRERELEAVLRSLFQMLAQVTSQQQAKDLLDTIRIYVMSVNPVIGEQKMNELVTEFWPVQPEPGSVADQLIKKGEARGEARGKAQERVSTIRTLQSIAGLAQSSVEELASQSLDELQATIEALQQQIASRLK